MLWLWLYRIVANRGTAAVSKETVRLRSESLDGYKLRDVETLSFEQSVFE